MASAVDDAPGVGPCDLCEREQPLTFHHLIPRAVHKKPRFRKLYTKQEMRTTGIEVCRLCHDGIHALIHDEKELARSFNSREALMEHPRLAKHIAWVRKQK